MKKLINVIQQPIWALTLLAFLMFEPLIAQNSKLEEQFRSYRAHNPLVKVHLHTNKVEYLAGENVWFKAYLVDYYSSLPDTVFDALKVDLVTHDGQVVDIVLLKLEKGIGNGTIALPDSLPGGNYALRAYNDYILKEESMQMFQQVLTVENPIEKNFIRRNGRREKKKYNKKIEELQNTYQVAFYPESGSIIAGTENKVVMRVSNFLGEGADYTAVIKNSNDAEVAEIKSIDNGISEFVFLPQTRETYYAEVNISGEKDINQALPDIQSSGFLIQAHSSREIENLEIQQINTSSLDTDSKVYAILHSQGQAKKVKVLDGTGELIEFNTLDHTSPGINYLTIADAQGTVYAERAFFAYQLPELNPDINLLEITKEDSLFLSLDISIPEMAGHQGSFSVSVSEVPDRDNVRHKDLFSQLMLSSALEKTFERPGGYLQKKEYAHLLDYLMIINGNPRFQIQNVMTYTPSADEKEFVTGLGLRGNVSPRGSSTSTGITLVELSANLDGKQDLHRTETDKEGNFVFEDLEFQEYVKVEITPRNDIRGRRLVVELDEFVIPEVDLTYHFRQVEVPTRGDEWQRVKKPTVFMENRGVEDLTDLQTIYGNADQVIYMDDMPSNISNMVDVIRGRVPGVTFRDGLIIMRGTSSVNMSSEPVFLIDGNVVSKNAFLGLSVREVERIEILKGSSAAIYGSRGANGAIGAITRKGSQELTPTFEFIVKGFSLEEDFLSNLYGMNESGKLESDQLFQTYYWEPNLVFDNETEKRVTFPVFTETESYFVEIEGIDNNGRLLSKRLIIQAE